jgi:hypothetical protein
MGDEMANETSTTTTTEQNDTKAAIIAAERVYDLARLIILTSIFGVMIFGALLILVSFMGSIKATETANSVLTAILPLFGTWVGTILAFYFSKANFEAATTSVTKIAESKIASVDEKLRATLVSDSMIKNDSSIYKINLDDDPTKAAPKLLDVKKELEAKGYNRLPVLNQLDQPRCVIHLSLIDKYLLTQAQVNPPVKAITDWDFRDLIGDSAYQDRLLKESFFVIKQSDTLATAKLLMDQSENCQDVFVTDDGSRNGKVIGWITNVIIENEAAKLALTNIP